MKKRKAISIALLSVATLLIGFGRDTILSAVAPLAADTQETDSHQAAQKENTALPEIDTSVPIRSGARIAVVSKATKGEFWSLVESGMKQAISDINDAYGFSNDEKITMSFEGAEDESDVENQVNTLDAVIAENPDVVCVSAADQESCSAQLEAAKENGIPVLTFDSSFISQDLVSGYLRTDNTEVGKIAATHLAEAVGEEGMVAVFSAQEKTQSCKERVEGFLDAIADYEGIEVVQVLYSDQVVSMDGAIKGVLEIYPDLKGVFCTNADVSEMYLSLAKDAGRDSSISFVGTDATSVQVEAIRDGREVGTVSQQPYVLGYQTIWTAVQLTAEEDGSSTSDASQIFEPVWIDAANLDDPANTNYIYG